MATPSLYAAHDRTLSTVTSVSIRASRRTNIAIWTLQILLASLFLFAGGMKLIMPAALLAQQSGFSGAFMKFIGVAETLGAIGLILPWALRIRAVLTPVAASGLVIIMVGATCTTVAAGQLPVALLPGFVGTLCAVVAYTRFRYFQS